MNCLQIFLCYTNLVCSITNKSQNITMLCIYSVHVAHLSMSMATFPNMHSNHITHNARKKKKNQHLLLATFVVLNVAANMESLCPFMSNFQLVSKLFCINYIKWWNIYFFHLCVCWSPQLQHCTQHLHFASYPYNGNSYLWCSSSLQRFLHWCGLRHSLHNHVTSPP